MKAITNIGSSNGGGGGHVIQNASGTELNQRSNLQFGGYFKAADDSTNSKTAVTNEPTEITWNDWNELTDEQKRGTKWLITGITPTPPTPVIPEGATVTPINDIQLWLNCANIWDKDYTTLAEVLADTDTLVALMASDNAVDYLVRSTSWATGLTASETAMQAIGASDYASTTLLSDSTWNSAIQNSAYFEYVDNLKNPNMTGYTTPSGVASANSEYSAYYPAWKALDGANSPDGMDCWHSTQRADHWIQYKFADTSFRVLKIEITDRYTGAWSGTVNLTFKRSSDGPAIYTTSYTQANNSKHSFVITADNSGDTCRLELTTSSSGYVTMGILNFYGRQTGGVQTWLHAANITDKIYTTLSEVLADSTTLSALMASEDAVDYLVTAKGWADDICSDSNAMTYIGLNNYASNTLLADATWRTAICNSTYFESVLNVKIPVMTSNNTPSGKCTASYQASGGTKAAWYAFDGNASTEWATYMQNVADAWIGYEFAEACTAYKYYIYLSNAVQQDYVVLKASSDGSNFVDIIENIPVTNTISFTGLVTKNFILGKYIRMRTWASIAGYSKYCRELQIWGRKDV